MKKFTILLLLLCLTGCSSGEIDVSSEYSSIISFNVDANLSCITTNSQIDYGLNYSYDKNANDVAVFTYPEAIKGIGFSVGDASSIIFDDIIVDINSLTGNGDTALDFIYSLTDTLINQQYTSYSNETINDIDCICLTYTEDNITKIIWLDTGFALLKAEIYKGSSMILSAGFTNFVCVR